ncbi:MAG: septum formation initiator family protein [Rhodothermales bacterium]|nr:septum formation initiator family protein [Rhodothermales bacterium]MCA0268012.1 septum formation initiator family protein [Bacteroidota bacterium]
MDRRKRFRTYALVALALGAFAWVAFFDTHSLMNRVRWSRELTRMEAENARLTAENARIEDEIAHADEPEVVERVAREQYGMRRPGETVYRLAVDSAALSR